MTDTRVALVTGANKGIGRQIAQDLAAHDFTVLVGSRDLANGEAAAAEIDGDARAIQLDVTDQGSIDAAAARIRDELGRLDVLVNNAAISRVGHPEWSLQEVGAAGRLDVVPLDELRAMFETNVFGLLAVTQAMLPLLREAPAGRIVNLGSGAGSLTRASDPDDAMRGMFGIYSASKTAVNALTVGLAVALEGDGIKVNSVSPGFVATDLNNFAGTKTVEEGAREPVRAALAGDDGPTGAFYNDEGPIDW